MEDFVYGVDFIDEDNGWAAEWLRKICHTTDGGEHWLTLHAVRSDLLVIGRLLFRGSEQSDGLLG